MATKPFLTADEFNEATLRLWPPAIVVNGDEKQIDKIPSKEFSTWLEMKLLARLSAHPSWKAAGPIALGSWARGELSPKSDIDLLFVGDETEVLKLVTDFSKQGLKLRYRMPEDMSDWTKGVESFDVLALLGAISLLDSNTASGVTSMGQRLADQKAKIRESWRATRKSIVRAMINERKARAGRFDSITNYLEPNLKYGPGGLRDLEQALALRMLFPERFESDDDHHAFDVLLYYKRFFLLVRQKLHLSEGATDLLTAPEQAPLAKWLGFQSPRDFMKEIQKGVSRVSFYADWAFEKATSTKGRLIEVDRRRLATPKHLFQALKTDSSVLMQNRVRLHADRVFESVGVHKELGRRKDLDLLIGRELTAFISPSNSEGPLVALFRARLIDHCVPEFRKIVGHVQHDQYHRFSVDAHILQAVRELGRLKKNPKRAGRLAKTIGSLTKLDWEILSFACLYHDIAKGRAGDHSIEGVAIAEHDLKAFGKTRAFIREVEWLVEEHLILSNAAFRENPASPQTWAKLAARGVSDKRIALLAAFTFVDIRATNPEAWTPWKERLLNEVVIHLENPESASAIQFARLKPEWVDRLDSFPVSMIPPKKLSEDLDEVIVAQAKRSGEDLAPKVLKAKGGQTWIRFHSREDRPGLFAHYVGALGLAGLSVRHASIHTFAETGVYDWFEVKTDKAVAPIVHLVSLALKNGAGQAALAQAASKPTASAKAKSPSKKVTHFDEVSLASETKQEWVISFRGKDQAGALLRAAKSLAQHGAEIQWARVHTWGRQIDDVFGVRPPGEISSEDFLLKLRSSLEDESS